MKTLDYIPQTKIQRAGKLLKIGAQVGKNYAKYVGNRIVLSEADARKKLNTANASNIYDGLSELKGSALKMAQMMSLDDGLLPKEFVEKFSLAQFSVPPLSGPLARKVFKKNMGKSPEEVFTFFERESSYAASIGQVHRAEYKGNKVAVKIQYPGVSQSIISDLKLVKPIALRMLNLKSDDVEDYFVEVQDKLLEETDYRLEKENLEEARYLSSVLPKTVIPKIYDVCSGKDVLTMEWMEGLHLSEFSKEENTIEERNAIAQALWDFYLFHIHNYKKVHADPHPGNFKVSPDKELVVLDFGCMKDIPEDFYHSFFKLADLKNVEDDEVFEKVLQELDIITENDNSKAVETIKSTFKRMLCIINKPFQYETFDFSSPDYYHELLLLGNDLKNDETLKSLNGKRGSKHFVYVNRTLIGLLGLMNSLNAGDILVDNYKKYATK
ncbi:AarF/ABC1/UbiB kinase family protein [Crocinitomicaceae bacterium]|nr:AarF/ABC1/UbiB kinase family protein [Crocinitomicaceae bacterium]